nr:EOG090X04W0 [Ilyocryptus agilis]
MFVIPLSYASFNWTSDGNSADPMARQVKMKIHNLNVEDLMEETRRNKLLDVFRDVLWPESSEDLQLIELHSALASGGRRPARRSDGEGVVLTVGSHGEFSELIRELEREVSPLWPLRQCPRDFKKTSAERYFRTKGFLVDWCSFKLIPQNSSLLVATSTASNDFDRTKESVSHSPGSQQTLLVNNDLWRAPAKCEIPVRSYVADGVVAIFIPLVVLLILAAVLTMILGIHPEGAETEEGQLYEGVFEEMPFLKAKTQTETSGKAASSEIPTRTIQAMSSLPRASDSTTPTLSRVKRNQFYDPMMMDSTVRGSSPFLMSSTSSPPHSPVSTLTRSVYPTTTRSTPGAASWDRGSTLGRPEPPPYCGSLSK